MSSPSSFLVAFSIIILCFSFDLANGHSWIECTDYAGDATQYPNWSGDLCKAYPRCAKTELGFGKDTQDQRHYDGTDCQRCNGAGTVATYRPGQTVYVAYPANNHANDRDELGTVFSRTGLGGTFDTFTDVKTYDPINGFKYDGTIKGFSNCPGAAADREDGLCTNGFKLEDDLAPGTYTFKWVWKLNTDAEAYSTCWNVRVEGTTTVAPTEAPPTSPTEALPTSTEAPPTSTEAPPTSPTVAPTEVPAPTVVPTYVPPPTVAPTYAPAPTTPCPTTKPPKKASCRGKTSIPGIHRWCRDNCARGYCPSNVCVCSSKTDRPKSCSGVIPKLNDWCRINCSAGFCPSTHCRC